MSSTGMFFLQSLLIFSQVRNRGTKRGMFSMRRGSRVLSALVRSELISTRSLKSKDNSLPWLWWESIIARNVKEKRIEWTPVLVVTKVSFDSRFRKAKTRVSWWRTECDG